MRSGAGGRERRSRVWDSVVKVGGSLYASPRLGALLRVLAKSARRRPLLVVPGGGPFADTVREAWRRHRLSERAAHRMALLGMDQLGLLLCDLEASAVPVRTLREAREAARGGRLPVLLAARLAAAARGLPASWSVTSDSVAAWVARRARARRLVLIKSVRLWAPRMPVWRLVETGVIDRAFPEAASPRIRCWIVNGRRLERVHRLLEGDPEAGIEVDLPGSPFVRARAAPGALRGPVPRPAAGTPLRPRRRPGRPPAPRRGPAPPAP